jgi:hypothetical protein
MNEISVPPLPGFVIMLQATPAILEMASEGAGGSSWYRNLNLPGPCSVAICRLSVLVAISGLRILRRFCFAATDAERAPQQ